MRQSARSSSQGPRPDTVPAAADSGPGVAEAAGAGAGDVVARGRDCCLSFVVGTAFGVDEVAAGFEEVAVDAFEEEGVGFDAGWAASRGAGAGAP
jgi:hypothetical protein